MYAISGARCTLLAVLVGLHHLQGTKLCQDLVHSEFLVTPVVEQALGDWVHHIKNLRDSGRGVVYGGRQFSNHGSRHGCVLPVVVKIRRLSKSKNNNKNKSKKEHEKTDGFGVVFNVLFEWNRLTLRLQSEKSTRAIY